jgi:hypothetical protein
MVWRVVFACFFDYVNYLNIIALITTIDLHFNISPEGN